MSDIIDSREKRSFPAVPTQLVMSNPGEVFLILNPVRLVTVHPQKLTLVEEFLFNQKK